MQTDEQAIRQLVATWMAASKAGDVETVLSLVTDDVVFLLPGRPPMHRADFAAALSAQAGADAPAIEGSNEIQEINILGEWAYLWQKLTVLVTPSGAAPIRRTGHTLTILRKENGKWLLARDANLLALAAE